MQIVTASNLKRKLFKDPIQWVMAQQKFRKWLHELGVRPLGHSTVVWFREASDMHTRVTLRNYFNLNYKLASPVYEFTLFNHEGEKVYAWQETAQPDQTFVVDSRQLIAKAGLGKEFDGALAIEVQNKDLFPPRYLRANVDYFNPLDFVSTVHDQARLFRRTSKDIQTLVHVLQEPDTDTGVVLINSFRYKANPKEFFARVSLELYNHTGESRKALLSPIPSCGQRLVWLKDVFPQSIEFLGGKPGGLRIHSNIAMPRCVPVIKKQGRGYSVNHTVGDHDPAIYARTLLKSEEVPDKDWAPIWTSFVREDAHFHTFFSFFNNWEPRTSYKLDFRVFDSTGRNLFEIPEAFEIKPNQTRVLWMKDFLREHDTLVPFIGSIHGRITPRRDQALFPGPGMLQVNTGWENNGYLALSNNQTFWYCNTETDIKHPMVQSRTKMFGRIVSNPEQETFLILINPSSSEHYDHASQSLVRVDEASGKNKLETSIKVPPQGTIFVSFDELFPDLRNFLSQSGGVSSMVVQDRNAKLLGYLMLKDRVTGAIGADHLFGG